MRKTASIAVMLVLAAACATPTAETTTSPATVTTAGATATTAHATTSVPDGFPVTIAADNGSVSIETRPESIVSLSTVATEMLFEIGAGPQVVAVDDQSNYPAEAPITELSGFTPNIEAILGYRPDLVVVAYDPGDLIAGLEAVGVPVIHFDAAVDVPGVYRQIESLGLATGHEEAAAEVNQRIEADLAEIVAGAAGAGEGRTYYHEIDSTFYTVTSSTFFGQIYKLFGLVNIADEADNGGSGYPQLSGEYIVLADPGIIFLANTLYGESAETVAARPGWDVMTAVIQGDIIELDSDIASRWGPRIVDLARAIADAISDQG
ncbi:MAG: ABC transporter substrate-binding protein [Acidimicrobiia bacterium]